MKITMTIGSLILMAILLVALSLVIEPLRWVVIILLVVALLLVLMNYLQKGGRGYPLTLKKEGKYELLKSIPPASREEGDESWKLLVRDEKTREVLFVGFPHPWLFLIGNAKKERLEITKIKGRFIYTLYLEVIPRLPGVLIPTQKEIEFEAASLSKKS